MVDVRYEQPSGYRPAPLDLSHMVLGAALEAAVDALAENEHNAWAEQLIRQGWTYGALRVRAAAHTQGPEHTPAQFNEGNVISSTGRSLGKIVKAADDTTKYKFGRCTSNDN